MLVVWLKFNYILTYWHSRVEYHIQSKGDRALRKGNSIRTLQKATDMGEAVSVIKETKKQVRLTDKRKS